MRFAINIPNFGSFANPRDIVALAQEADQAGWDGFFLWDHVLWSDPENYAVAEPWVTLAAMAQASEHIRIGPMITPLPRRRPWQVARQALTLDHLSNGRAVLGVGLGGDWFGDYSAFGETTDQRAHGEMLDEALDVLCGLWSGETFHYAGKHFAINGVQMLPIPLQQPRIPLWVAGVWPGTRPFQRAARFDGVAPISKTNQPFTPTQIRDMLAYIGQYRTSSAPFDVIIAGGPLQAAEYTALAEAGVTWYQVGFWASDSVDDVRNTIRGGIPATST